MKKSIPKYNVSEQKKNSTSVAAQYKREIYQGNSDERFPAKAVCMEHWFNSLS